MHITNNGIIFTQTSQNSFKCMLSTAPYGGYIKLRTKRELFCILAFCFSAKPLICEIQC